jgi:hypothetical protein
MARYIDPPECGDENCALMAMTRVHVLEGKAHFVVPLPHGEGSNVVVDYLCDECWERCSGQDSGNLNHLRAVCVECLREIVKLYVSDVFCVMERLGCDPNDLGAFRAIQGGLRDGLPLCCISFFVLIWSNMVLLPDGKVEAEITGHYRQLLDAARELGKLKHGYVPCPACLLEILGEEGNGPMNQRAGEVSKS